MIQDFLADLRRRVAGEVRNDTYSRLLYSTDASLYQVMPTGVLIPKTADDVQAAVELAHKYKTALLPRGGGSSLCGQGVNAALIIDTSRHLDRVLEINAEERWARVQPGVVLDVLNGHCKGHGLQFGPDPASAERATLGGIVSNNSSGAHSVLYGMTADHVLEMTCLLNDASQVQFKPLDADQLAWHKQKTGREGEIYRAISEVIDCPDNRDVIRSGTPKHWRRSGGYNLARFICDGSINHNPPYGLISQHGKFFLGDLVCGGEGTLATITELKVNLVPRPKQMGLVIIEFSALMDSLLATPFILETRPDAIELVDDLSLKMADSVPEFARLKKTFLQGDAFCFLAVEYTGVNEGEIRSKCEALIAHIKACGVRTGTMNIMLNPQQQANVWKVRKVGLGLMMSQRSEWKPLPFVEDTAVPPEHLAEYIGRIARFCQNLGTNMTYYAHASAGCLHVRPLINLKRRDEIEKMKQIALFVCELLGDYGGAMASEHAHGRLRSWMSERFYGKALYGLYQQIKTTFDPDNIFNPGNLVAANGRAVPALDQHLRYDEHYKTIEITPHLHFDTTSQTDSQPIEGNAQSQAFMMEIEMCNGAGVCRKTTTGAMCPSFIATREEEHATRGRANMLRAAMSGLLPIKGLDNPRLYETMELCVSCKACKAECPSSVDMARLKTEFLAQYYSKNTRPLRDFLFANIDSMARFSSGPLVKITNTILSNAQVKGMVERLLGISQKRTLPHFASQSFRHWFSKRTKPTENRTQNAIVLFADTMNTYVYPHVAIAATQVLEKLGFTVILPNVTDAGRPALSKGMVKLAQATAKRALDVLYPLAQEDLPIIFLEPSDWSAVVDDYETLLPNDTRLPIVSKHCVLFDSFIETHITALKNSLSQTKPTQNMAHTFLVHTHCHQKSLLGGRATLQVLGCMPNAHVSEVDSSCCGMAGTFGYEAEHYDISLKMSEHRLAPSVRALAHEAVVVAAGISCRQQIAHATGRQALHLAEALNHVLSDQA